MSIYSPIKLKKYKLINGVQTYTSDAWDTDCIYPIRMKDGSYALSIAIKHEDNESDVLDEHKIYLDENNVPYVQADYDDFNEDNCLDEIIKYSNTSGGRVEHKGLLFNKSDGIPQRNNILIDFTGKCIGTEWKKYFSGIGRSINFLNQEGLAILLKLFETPDFKKQLDRRFSPVTEAELLSKKEEILKYLSAYFENPKNSVPMYIIKEQLDKYNGLINGEWDEDKVITLDLDDYKELLNQDQNS